MLASHLRRQIFQRVSSLPRNRILNVHRSLTFYQSASRTRTACFHTAHPSCYARAIPGKEKHQDASSSRLASEGLELPIGQEEVSNFVSQITEDWPTQNPPPHGWSTDWKNWKYLLTFFYPSEYFLEIPQGQLLFNIQYGLQGEVQPIMFSNAKQAFVFSVINEQTGEEMFYHWDGVDNSLMRYSNVTDLENLLKKMGGTDNTVEFIELENVEPHPTGEEVVKKILSGDDTVLPLLLESFYPYNQRSMHAADALHEGDGIGALRGILQTIDERIDDTNVDAVRSVVQSIEEALDTMGDLTPEHHDLVEYLSTVKRRVEEVANSKSGQ